MKRLITTALVVMSAGTFAWAQSPQDEAKVAENLEHFFQKYKPKKVRWDFATRLLDYKLNPDTRTLEIHADASLASAEFTDATVADLYRQVRKSLPKTYRDYTLTIYAGDMLVDQLTPCPPPTDKPHSLWGDIDYEGRPWVDCASSPYVPSNGLYNRHLSLWASHGRYYDHKKAEWRWQRPKLFGTTEDLFSASIVVPYLIPMLENAGANVFTPRERDWQPHEIIVDNDMPSQGTAYIEVNSRDEWERAPLAGFASHVGAYSDGENPFAAGTLRMAKATSSKKRYSLISYQPEFPADGQYAVYVSYASLDNSVDDACYTVWHKGQPTEFRVNQRMGGGTWVYLGTFSFDKGSSEYNRVVLTNRSERRGVVTADAVRFGGGMGNIERGGTTSGLPRAMEGARYYAQWAGMPYSVYSPNSGTDDYRDDINARSLTVNHLAGGSVYMPTTDGLRVPIELNMALHSDAGYAKDLQQIVGSLAICTTDFNGGRLDAGISRLASRDFAQTLLDNATADLQYKYGVWHNRGLLDRNYSETRLPGVPSAILETLSHQNFPDMRLGQDPNFKFTLARSIYKTILRFVSAQHGVDYCVTPLTPRNFSVETDRSGTATLRWTPTVDPQEPTSFPTAYIVYTRRGEAGFDNGTLVRGRTSLELSLDPGVLYSFRVVALTRGGRSFPTEELCAAYNPDATKGIVIINGFHRLAAPAVRAEGSIQGFDFDTDPGVSFGTTCAWVGRQLCFDTKRIGIEDETGLGYTGDEFQGMFIAGNDRNYVRCHAEAIAASHRYNIASCSSGAVENGSVRLTDYTMADIVLGLERDDRQSLEHYKTFSAAMQRQLTTFAAEGGSLLVSGAYVASDMTATSERQFLASVLRCSYGGNSHPGDSAVSGMGTDMQIYSTINAQHYPATVTDVLRSVDTAFPAMRYADGQDAAVACNQGTHRSFAMGFPFECIKDAAKRTSIMQGILRFLME